MLGMGKSFFSRKETNERTRSKGYLGRKKVRDLRSQGDIQDHADVLNLSPSKILEHGNEIQQFIVMSVREPATDGYRVLRVENVGSWGIVDDDRLTEITANLGEILIDGQNGRDLTGEEGNKP